MNFENATGSVKQSPDPVVNFENATDPVKQSLDPVVNFENARLCETKSRHCGEL